MQRLLKLAVVAALGTWACLDLRPGKRFSALDRWQRRRKALG